MKRLQLLAIILIFFPAAVSNAATTTTFVSGAICAHGMTISPQGAQNWNNYDVIAICPIPSWTQSGGIDQGVLPTFLGAATLIYTDNSSGSFRCFVTVENWDGNTYGGPSLYSCSTYGGCPSDSERGWKGQGQLNWTLTNLGRLAGVGWYPDEISISCSNMPGSRSIIRSYNFTTSDTPP